MTYGMKPIDQQAQVASIELAGALLRAWASGDRPALEAELNRSSCTPPDLPDTGEAERLQMLGAIAARLKAFADPLTPASADPGIGVCVNLLSHLARPALPERTNHAGWVVFRSATRSATPDSVRSRPVRPGILRYH